MSQTISDSAIIATYRWSRSIEWLLGHFRRAGTPTTAEHIEAVWAKAKERGDLPPLERPPEGFDPRQAALLRGLVEAGRRCA
ncbi:MAG: hypothetical protein Q8M26_08845 [Pseudolabrys sp.]|nr:hypothetical protein [Pseudolabrys sp.]